MPHPATRGHPGVTWCHPQSKQTHSNRNLTNHKLIILEGGSTNPAPSCRALLNANSSKSGKSHPSHPPPTDPPASGPGVQRAAERRRLPHLSITIREGGARELSGL